MKQNCKSLEEYLEQIEYYLIGFPKVERENYLEELADGILQQFHDYCIVTGISQEKTESIVQYIETLDKPKEVAQQYIKTLDIQLPLWGFPLRLWIKFERIISRNTVFAAWLIGLTFGFLPIIIKKNIPWLVELFTLRTSGELGNGKYYEIVTTYPFDSICLVITFFVICLLSWRIGRTTHSFIKVSVFTILSIYTYSVPLSLGYFFENIDNMRNTINSSAIHITGKGSWAFFEDWEPLSLLGRQLNYLLGIVIFGLVISFMIIGIQRIRKTSTSNWRRILGLSLAILTILVSLSLPTLQISALIVEPDSTLVYSVQSIFKGLPESDLYKNNESYAAQCWILGNLSILWRDYVTVNITKPPSVHFEHFLNEDDFEYDNDPRNMINGSFIWIWPFTAITEWLTYAAELNGTYKDDILIQASVQEESQTYIENHTSLGGRMDLVVDLKSRLPTLIILEGNFTQMSTRDSIIITRCYAFSFPKDVDITTLFVTDLIIFIGLAVIVTLGCQGAIWLNEYLPKVKQYQNTQKSTY